jgi:hypothetical protein
MAPRLCPELDALVGSPKEMVCWNPVPVSISHSDPGQRGAGHRIGTPPERRQLLQLHWKHIDDGDGKSPAQGPMAMMFELPSWVFEPP